MTDAEDLEQVIGLCERCPRLRAHCENIARVKVRRYRNETYWGKPVPGFGDPNAYQWVIGLAPGAHGANRTGRMFTGDDAGSFLYGALYRAGLANQPHSEHRNDGLTLRGVYISAVVRCAPPHNKPASDERRACASFLKEEFVLLQDVTVIVALGKVAYDACRRLLKSAGWTLAPGKFRHLGVTRAGAPLARSRTHAGARSIRIIASYHPSRQNTRTRRLTTEMFDRVWRLAKQFAPLGH
jgi:uracil-DNA glycosylase family 4